MPVAIVKADELVKRYPKPGGKNEQLVAVDGVSLAIETGEVFGILGPNGAGKTTTLEMLEGLTDIDGGEAWIAGIDVKAEPHKVKEIIGVQLQANEYFDHLSLSELLRLFSRLYRRDNDPHGAAQTRAARGQGGRQAREPVGRPKAALLDRVRTRQRAQSAVPGRADDRARSAGQTQICGARRESERQSGMTIVMTTHNMEEAEHLCGRIAIMDHGKIIAEGTPRNLIMQHAPEPPAQRRCRQPGRRVLAR